MPDDVLRLRATVVSDEALANIRKIGREIGLVQSQGGAGMKSAGAAAQAAKPQFAELSKSIGSMGKELMSAVPALGGFGIGVAGAGLAARVLIGTLGDIAAKMVDMKHASKELGMTTQELQAFSTEARKAGIAPEAMMAGLGSFKKNVTDIKLNIGDLRGELTALGAGGFVNALKTTTTQGEAIKKAFDFKAILDREDASGEKGRRFFDKIGLGAEAARLSYEQYARTVKEKQPWSDDDLRKAQQFQDSLVIMGDKFDLLKTKVGLALMPHVQRDLDDVNKFLGLLDKLDKWWDDWTGKTNKPKQDPLAWLADAMGAGEINKWLRERGLAMDPGEAPATAPAEAAPARAPTAAAPAPAPTAPAPAAPPPTEAAPPAAPLSRDYDPIRQQSQARRDRAREDAARAAREREQIDQLDTERQPPAAERPRVQRMSFDDTGGSSGFQRASFAPQTGGSASESAASRIIKIGVFDALVEFKSYVQSGGSQGGVAGIVPAAPAGAAAPERPEQQPPERTEPPEQQPERPRAQSASFDDTDGSWRAMRASLPERETGGNEGAAGARVIKTGVFEGMVEFRNYVQSGGGSGDAGIVKASLPGTDLGAGGLRPGAGGVAPAKDGAGAGEAPGTKDGQASARPGPGGQGVVPGAAPVGAGGGAPAGAAAPAGGAPAGAAVPAGAAGAGARGGGAAPKGEAGRIAVAKAAMKDQLRKEGVPEANLEEASNLLAGQALSESDLVPTRVHDKGTGYGIYGARDDPKGRSKRRSDMINWMKEQGYAKDSLEGQAKYMAHEATSSGYSRSRAALMGATPGSRAANVKTLISDFERPSDQGPKEQARRQRRTATAAGVAADAKAPQTADDAPSQAPGAHDTSERVLKGRDLKGTDPRITEIVGAAARGLPPGYKVQPTSGMRDPRAPGFHPHGKAQDWQIIGPDGKPVQNRGDDKTGLYTKLAQNAYGYQEKYHPNLTGKFQWGGQFGTSKRNPNEPDLMHFDVGGRRGRLQRYSRENIGATLPPEAPTKNIDTAVAPPTAKGSVNVTVNSNGTKAETGVKSEGKLFSDTQVKQHRQMQRTENAEQTSI